jgi:hypothetical protein
MFVGSLRDKASLEIEEWALEDEVEFEAEEVETSIDVVWEG